MNNSSTTKLVQRLFSLSKRHIEMIAELMTIGLFSSQSDIVRQAIAEIYNKNIKTKEKSYEESGTKIS